MEGVAVSTAIAEMDIFATRMLRDAAWENGQMVAVPSIVIVSTVIIVILKRNYVKWDAGPMAAVALIVIVPRVIIAILRQKNVEWVVGQTVDAILIAIV